MRPVKIAITLETAIYGVGTRLVAASGVYGVLSDVEVTYYRSRIDDVLAKSRISAWQRGFLTDMRHKLDRYGTTARLSDRQLAILRRLTVMEGDAVLRLVASNAKSQTPRRYRHRRLSYWGQKRLILAAVLVVLAAASIGRQISDTISLSDLVDIAASSQPRNISITDGDTIKMDDGTRVRLVGFNTPEKFEPRCEHERQLGIKASKRLVELVSSGQSAVTEVACSCSSGTEGTDRCNYGRSCGILKVDGRDVGQTLILEGLAVPFVCGSTGCPPTPRPWCG